MSTEYPALTGNWGWLATRGGQGPFEGLCTHIRPPFKLHLNGGPKNSWRATKKTPTWPSCLCQSFVFVQSHRYLLYATEQYGAIAHLQMFVVVVVLLLRRLELPGSEIRAGSVTLLPPSHKK